MRQAKKIFTGVIIALVLVVISIPAFAASIYTTPAEAVAGLTGRTIDSVIAERMEGNKTYGTIAAEADKLDEFKTEMLEMKRDHLSTQVKAGSITQEKADALLEGINEKRATCDGTGSSKIGQGFGVKFGSDGTGQRFNGVNRGGGMGYGQGKSQGQGQGGGHNMNKGVCINQ